MPNNNKTMCHGIKISAIFPTPMVEMWQLFESTFQPSDNEPSGYTHPEHHLSLIVPRVEVPYHVPPKCTRTREEWHHLSESPNPLKKSFKSCSYLGDLSTFYQRFFWNSLVWKNSTLFQQKEWTLYSQELLMLTKEIRNKTLSSAGRLASSCKTFGPTSSQ